MKLSQIRTISKEQPTSQKLFPMLKLQHFLLTNRTEKIYCNFSTIISLQIVHFVKYVCTFVFWIFRKSLYKCTADLPIYLSSILADPERILLNYTVIYKIDELSTVSTWKKNTKELGKYVSSIQHFQRKYNNFPLDITIITSEINLKYHSSQFVYQQGEHERTRQ